MLFDSHAHFNIDKKAEADLEKLAAGIEGSELSYVMNIGVDLETSFLACEQAKRYPWCYATVGVHPQDVHKMDDEELYALKTLAMEDKVKAIGEIGLDYFHMGATEDKEEQKEWFRKQIRLANEISMPIAIHCREADGDCLEILKQEGAFSKERIAKFPARESVNGIGEKDARVLLHCYSGSSELAEEYVKLGATISIAGPVTFKNAKKQVKTVERIPIEFLLAETDSPFLTPEPHRGERNTPLNVKFVVAKFAEIKGITYEEAASITCRNAKRFYGIED